MLILSLLSNFTETLTVISTIKYFSFRTFITLILPAIFFSCANTEKPSKIKIDNEPVSLISSVDSSKFLRFNNIHSIYKDSRGNIWIGSHSDGIAMWDGKLHTYFSTPDGLVDNQVRSIQEDKLGNIWIATGHGISIFTGDEFRIRLNMKDWNNSITSDVWESNPNDLWFHAGNKSGVYRFDGQHLNYLAFPTDQNETVNDVYLNTCFAKGQNNQIWFGTYPAVFGFDGEIFSSINNESLGLNGQNEYMHVRSIFEDSRGNLWIGNNGLGLLLYDGEDIVNFTKKHKLTNEHFTIHNLVSDNTGTLARIFSIEEDVDGNLWFGTADAGVWKYDRQNLKNYNSSHGFEDHFIKVIYCDDDGVMWFGTQSGVYQKSGKEKFVRIF